MERAANLPFTAAMAGGAGKKPIGREGCGSSDLSVPSRMNSPDWLRPISPAILFGHGKSRELAFYCRYGGRRWEKTNRKRGVWLFRSIRPFKDELARLVAANFAGHSLWAWKEPRTCLLLPLWREALEKTGTKLSCLFVVRSPVDVASSLFRRDAVPFNKALGIWFHYNIAALKDAAGLPIVFLNYDHLLASWEPELRRCAATLGLDWPKDELQHREAMNSFIQPGLRHNQSSLDQLQELPQPVQELYQVLLEASTQPFTPDHRFDETINRLSKDFHAYASFFQNGSVLPPRNRGTRTWHRWQKSFRKHF